MSRKDVAVLSVVVGALIALMIPVGTVAAKGKPVGKVKEDDRETCYSCHAEVKDLKEGSKHAKLSCAVCHEKLKEHLADSAQKPSTNLELSLCGSCHKDQYNSFYSVDYEHEARKEKGTPTSRSPLQDKLLAGHGFTFEHHEPRGHAFMVVDQLVNDRFQGGRFQFKKGWQGINTTGKTWDVIEDTGKKLPETGMAGNPTCIQCKTSDHILTWKFMGDQDPKAKWSRSSDVVEFAKATSNPMGCIHCHDPHGTQPRIVRDGLIHAIDSDMSRNIFANSGKTDLKVVSFRDDFRKIGIMKKSDSRMMCAQCHAEYSCNAGTQWSDGKKVGYDDRRTNQYPLRNAKELLEHYKKRVDFYDFKHAITGARLVKMQHPEAETYAGSVHDRAGVGCADCHMPKKKGANGKMFSSHQVVRPAHSVKESCLGCHPKSSVKQKKYEIEAIRNYTKGKIRKAEYWLEQLIDTYTAAKRMGVGEEVLGKAREKHEEAHILWEYWTAENSDGFHNPDLARDTLAGSIAASKAGVKLLNDAIDAKTAGPATAAKAP